MSDKVEKAFKVAEAIVEASSRSQAKRLNIVHENTLAEALLELKKEIEELRAKLKEKS